MNAYELADDLEGWCDDVLSNQNRKNVFKKHAKMLRQQADRIAELEKFNKAILKKGGYPHKPLSDKEIVQISKTCDLNHVLGLIDFARAIEERHGIK